MREKAEGKLPAVAASPNGSIPIVRRHSLLYLVFALYYYSFLLMGFLDFARNDTKEMGSFGYAQDDTGRVIEKPSGNLPAGVDLPHGLWITYFF